MKSSGDNGRANHADLSFLSGANAGYLESLYREMLEQDATGSLPAQHKEWQSVFSSLPGMSIGFDPSAQIGYQAWFESLEHKQAQVSKLITAYRSLGHLRANIDPIGVMPRGSADEIRLERYDLGAEDLDTEFDTGDLAGGGRMTLREILDFLQAVYCGSIGYEIRYLHSLEKRVWLQRQAEVESRSLPFADNLRIEILERLTAAEGLEKYLHTRYVGQKRFSLEGGRVADSNAVGFDPAIRRQGGQGSGHRNGASRALECPGQYAGQGSRRVVQ